MINATFENSYGFVQLFGGENPLLEPIFVEGLALPEKEVDAAVFKLQEGQTVVNSRDLPRTITIKGHLYGDYKKAVRAARILYTDGTLTLTTPDTERVIEVRCIKFFDRKHLESGVMEGEIVFVCDKPYFHDKAQTFEYIYSRMPLLKTYFTLPTKLSHRISEGKIDNKGQVRAEPYLEIKNYDDKTQNGFTITNKTTGTVLSVSVEMQKGETIKIDIPKRTVTNNNGDNLLPLLSEISYLSDFYFVPGENVIEFVSSGDVRCECLYAVNYTEAII